MLSCISTQKCKWKYRNICPPEHFTAQIGMLPKKYFYQQRLLQQPMTSLQRKVCVIRKPGPFSARKLVRWPVHVVVALNVDYIHVFFISARCRSGKSMYMQWRLFENVVILTQPLIHLQSQRWMDLACGNIYVKTILFFDFGALFARNLHNVPWFPFPRIRGSYMHAQMFNQCFLW